jgi:hypothetical protein
VIQAIALGILIGMIGGCAHRPEVVAPAPVDDARDARLSLGVGACHDVTIIDPHGRTLLFGAGLPAKSWRNDYGSSANFFSTGGDRLQIHISEPPAGEWRVGITPLAYPHVVSLDGFTSLGCVAGDVIDRASNGYRYWWRLHLTLSSEADTCALVVEREQPRKL